MMPRDERSTRSRLQIVGFVVGCASAVVAWACPGSERSPDAKELPTAGSNAQAGAAADPPDAGVTGTVDAGSQTRRCRGVGRYESGKEGSYQPCCDGLREVFYKGRGESDGQRVCADVPLRIYACVRGECGDGICEEGEAAACGCASDCPQAEWTGPIDDERDAGAGTDPANVGFPDSCDMEELARFLQTSQTPVACGDLALGASDADQAAALDCVRQAIENEQAFQLFWRSQGLDSVPYNGVIANLEDDRRKTLSLVADATTFGLDIAGETATAAWAECALVVQTPCIGGIDSCLSCERSGGHICGCLPEGKRPGAPDGARVEVRCEDLEP